MIGAVDVGCWVLLLEWWEVSERTREAVKVPALADLAG